MGLCLLSDNRYETLHLYLHQCRQDRSDTIQETIVVLLYGFLSTKFLLILLYVACGF